MARWVLLHNRRLATPPGKGVRLMWKKKLIQILRILIIAVIVMILLTTKAY